MSGPTPYRVGVTGHLSIAKETLPELRKTVAGVLRKIRKGLPPEQEMVVLSPIAPGADTLVAEVALELGVKVECPLPFPPEIYRRSTSFTSQPDPEAAVRRFDEFIAELPWSVVLVEGDDSLSAVELRERSRADLEDSKRRDARYRAVGMHLVEMCDHLLALLEDEPTLDSTAPGAAAIAAEAIRGGKAISRIPVERAR